MEEKEMIIVKFNLTQEQLTMFEYLKSSELIEMQILDGNLAAETKDGGYIMTDNGGTLKEFIDRIMKHSKKN